MASLSEFLAMGGYAFYVWSSYGLGLLVLALNAVIPLVRKRRLLRSLPGGQREKAVS